MIDIVGYLALFIVVAWAVWFALMYLAKKVNLTWAKNVVDSPVGQAFGKSIDVTQEFAAYQALTAIRELPSVQASPEAMAACDVLRTTITQWTNK